MFMQQFGFDLSEVLSLAGQFSTVAVLAAIALAIVLLASMLWRIALLIGKAAMLILAGCLLVKITHTVMPDLRQYTTAAAGKLSEIKNTARNARTAFAEFEEIIPPEKRNAADLGKAAASLLAALNAPENPPAVAQPVHSAPIRKRAGATRDRVLVRLTVPRAEF